MLGETAPPPSPGIWHRHTVFFFLQLADLLTTLGCFYVGLREVNPLTGKLISVAGVFSGLLLAKLFCCLVSLPLRRLLWAANTAYLLIVTWNSFLFTLFGVANHKL